MVRLKFFLFETLASIGLVDLTRVSSEVITIFIVILVRVVSYFLEKYIMKRIKNNAE